mgnify:FL=1
MPNTCFISFRSQFFKYGCFSWHQILMWNPDFGENNITRWIRKGLLVRLRRGWFAFPEYLQTPDFAMYIAGRIYKPSYISLFSALSYYGMIPEAVTDITSITTLKTSSFLNNFGQFSYSSVKTSMFFGFNLKPTSDGWTITMATAEKALIDLLYLYPIYSSEDDMRELRLDEAFMQDEFNHGLADSYIKTIGSKTLHDKMQTLYNAYGI